MSGRKYTQQHEWIEVEDDIGTVGISDHAQEQLGELVYVELPKVGTTVDKGDQVAVVESVKAASEVYAPAGGEVVEVNETLNDQPGLVNTDATGDGWVARLKLSDPDDLDDLMDEAAYKEYLETLE